MKRVIGPDEAVSGFLPVPGGGGRFSILVDEQLGGSKNFSLLVNQVSGGYVSKEHAHPEEQCFYILSGRGRIRIEGVDYEVAPGMAAFCPAHSLHQVRVDDGEPLKYVIIYSPQGPERDLREKGEQAFSSRS